ncbi:MAG TPA: relaxase/mobilization nuclease domain-containing protein, partial [Thermoanaerobaculia bacterium]|nr:relaxase/mobilization nuclease domain-containing protein [Thermoanaerobaculia bacterium]
MITEIPRKMGRTPARLIDYLASPRRDQAEVIDTNLLGREMRSWADQLETVARMGRSRGGRFVKHMILAFAPEDPVESLDLREVVRFYLDKMGYGEAPFLAVLHQDTDHSHIHIVTTPRTWEGEPISQSWEHLRSVEVAREIERQFGLRPVPSPREARHRQLDQGEIRRAARLEEKPARARFQEELAEAALRSRSFDEFVGRAERAGYEVRAWVDEDDRLCGLSFGKDGLAFSGAQLGRDFRGPRFLEAFSLSLSEVPMAEPIPRPEGQLYVPAPSPAPLDLPPGRYHVAAVKPEALADPARRLTDADVAWVRSGWEPRHIQESRGWLGQE